MISICSYLIDTAGILAIENPSSGSVVFAAGRRVNRTANLDGTVSVIDFGYADGDRTFSVVLSPFTLSQLETVERIYRYHNKVTISARDGAYLASPEDYSVRDNGLSMSFLINSRISS